MAFFKNLFIALACFVSILFVQYYVRESYDNIIIQVFPSFFATIGGFYFYITFHNNFKKALAFTFVVNIFHEIERYWDQDIRIDINDIIAIVIASLLVVFLTKWRMQGRFWRLPPASKAENK